MIEDVLKNIGLNSDEVSIYTSLLTIGAQSASSLARNTTVKRTYIYTLTQAMLSRGLISQEKKGNTTVFAITSPEILETQAQIAKDRALAAAASLTGIMPQLREKFALVDERPLVKVAEGLDSLKAVYQDILQTQKPIYLFRSHYDDKHSEVDVLVNEQIKKQVAKGISAFVIGPIETDAKDVYLNLNAERLVEQRLLTNTSFILASQLIIYGEKVAIVSLKKAIITTVIQNIDFHDTCKQLFDYIWTTGEEEHENLIQGWIKESLPADQTPSKS